MIAINKNIIRDVYIAGIIWYIVDLILDPLRFINTMGPPVLFLFAYSFYKTANDIYK